MAGATAPAVLYGFVLRRLRRLRIEPRREQLIAPRRISRSRRFPHFAAPRGNFVLGIPCRRGLMNPQGCTGLRMLSRWW
jgi:hypothetical protein